MNSTETREEIIQDIVAIYKDADPFKKFVITVLIKASASNDTAPLHGLIKACPRNKSVKEAARKMIAMIEKNLASKGVQE